MPYNSLRDLDVKGKRVLLREDLNAPLDKATGQVTDSTRLQAAIPTIEELRKRGASVVIVSHLERPDGKPDPKLSLAPIAAELSKLLGTEVRLIAEPIGAAAASAVASLKPGDV